MFVGAHLAPAIKQNNADAVEELLKKGADVNFRDPDSGNTMLYLAVEEGNLNILQMLLDEGKDVAVEKGSLPWTEGSIMTALQYATFLRRPDMVEMLLRKGANKNLRNSSGLTACSIANMVNDSETKKSLECSRM